jgi:hypothetical protein
MKGIIKEDFSSYVIEHKNISINWLTYGVNLQKVCSNCKLQILNFIHRSIFTQQVLLHSRGSTIHTTVYLETQKLLESQNITT